MCMTTTEKNSKEYVLDGNAYLLTHLPPDVLRVEYNESCAYIRWPNSNRSHITIDMTGEGRNLFPPVPSGPREALNIACSELVEQDRRDQQANEVRRIRDAKAKSEIEALLSSLG